MERKLTFKGTEDTFSAESWGSRSKRVSSIVEDMRNRTKKSIWLLGAKEIKFKGKTIGISSSLEILPQHESEFIRRAIARFISNLFGGRTHAVHITLKVTDKK